MILPDILCLCFAEIGRQTIGPAAFFVESGFAHDREPHPR